MICVSSDFYWILQDILNNVIATLMMSAELATYDLLTITVAMEKIVGGLYWPTPFLKKVKKKIMFLIQEFFKIVLTISSDYHEL